MKTIASLLLTVMLLGAKLYSQSTVNVAWDANNDGGLTAGYIVRYGTISEAKNFSKDVGTATFTPINNLTPGFKYFFVVHAYNSAHMEGPPSNEVSFQTLPDDCLPPFGIKSISITPLRFVQTGSKGAGSLAEIHFFTASANSPVIHLAIADSTPSIPDSNNFPVELIDSLMDAKPGTNIKATVGIRFTIPIASGKHDFSIVAVNAALCKTVKSTGFSVTIP